MFVLLHLLALAVQLVYGSKSIPVWSDNYHVKGILHIPYSEIEEPFEGWYRKFHGMSRIDYYDGTVQTFQKSAKGLFGTSFKITPYTDEKFMNIRKCLKTVGSVNDPIETQALLPEMADFEFIGTEIFDGQQAERWHMIVPHTDNNKNSTYTMWLRRLHETDNSRDFFVPLRFEMKGYNIVFHSHYDNYYMDYELYEPDVVGLRDFRVADFDCDDITDDAGHNLLTSNPMAEFIPNSLKPHHAHQIFANYKQQFNKTYASQTEHHARHSNFVHNSRFVNSKNRANLGYRLQMNKLADFSQEEMKVLRGRINGKSDNGGFEFRASAHDISKLSPNGYFDWRLRGAVTPVKDQSVCGSCWAFSVIGAVEGAYFRKYNKLIKFSEQALVDCSWGFGNFGCDGGQEYQGYEWIVKHNGIPTDEEYGHYLGINGYCHNPNTSKIAQINRYYNVPSLDSESLRVALLKRGPISISINASPLTFSFYANGLYDDIECSGDPSSLNHAVLLVGYGHLDGQLYWIVKNSWSSYWGNDGYILISANNNICGVMTSPTFVSLV